MLTLAFVVALGASVAMLGISGAWAVVEIPETDEHSHDVQDVRDDADPLPLLDTQEDAMNSIEGVRVEIDPTFGTPRKIVANDGYLTGAASGDAEDVARGWISENLDLLGVSDAGSFDVIRNHELPGTGTRVITFQQTINELQTVYGGRINLAVKSDGRILSYTGNPTRSESLTGDFSLTEDDALSSVVSELAPERRSGFSPQQITGEADIEANKLLGATTEAAGIEYKNFQRGPFAAPSSVARVVFPTGDGLLPAFRVLFVNELDEAYDVVVDASSGEILYQRSLIAHQEQEEASGLVYPNYPGADRGGKLQSVSFAGDEDASPCGWLDINPTCQTTGQIDAPTTIGNNADTHANWDSFLVPNPTGDRAEDSDLAASGTQFNYPYENNWAKQKGQGVSYQADLNPAATSLFWHHNRIHDEYYNLGFTESAGNFQVNNFGKGGAAGADPLQGLVQAGAASGGAPSYTGRNNAYMLTMPDGMPSWSGMFLWEPIPASFESPYVDGDFDASVIQHEYTHGLTSRYVAGGEALGAFQSGSMGEGWSDWYALDYLYREGLESDAVTGKYVTGNDERGIRNWDFDENPTTYADIGYDIVGPEVHSDGEIWTAVLWDLRKALVAKYGEQRGGEIARRLITDAQPLTAPDPSFLDARDGILIAGEDRYRGIHDDLIWSAFARRGMGASASTNGGDDTDPTPGFDHTNDSRNGNIVGKVVNESTGKPVSGARVFLGDFEARATPTAKTGTLGGFGEKVIAGTYKVTVQAPGFGARTFNDVKVAAGKSSKLKFTLSPNLVSARNGAKIVNVSSQDPDNRATNLLDDSEASVWSTEKPPAPAPDAEPGKFDEAQISIKLREPTNVRAVRLSAFKNISDARFSAMKKWKIETSMDGKNWTLRKLGSFQADDPRPVTPELHLKRVVFDKPVQARFVRFTIDSAQSDSLGYAQAAELQVYSRTNEGFTPIKIDADKPVTDRGTIEAGNSAIGDPAGTGVTALGATGTAYQQACGTDPNSLGTQGTDGWISVLPNSFGDGNHVASVTGSSPQDQDIDLYFLNSRCEVVGSQATPSANESGVLPGGAKYVLTALYSGTNEDFTLTAKSAP